MILSWLVDYFLKAIVWRFWAFIATHSGTEMYHLNLDRRVPSWGTLSHRTWQRKWRRPKTRPALHFHFSSWRNRILGGYMKLNWGLCSSHFCWAARALGDLFPYCNSNGSPIRKLGNLLFHWPSALQSFLLNLLDPFAIHWQLRDLIYSPRNWYWVLVKI